jgi:uncharacterized protein (UPF0179 family)
MHNAPQPFKVGDRVRVNAPGRTNYHGERGVVVQVRFYGVRIRFESNPALEGTVCNFDSECLDILADPE